MTDPGIEIRGLPPRSTVKIGDSRRGEPTDLDNWSDTLPTIIMKSDVDALYGGDNWGVYVDIWADGWTIYRKILYFPQTGVKLIETTNREIPIEEQPKGNDPEDGTTTPPADGSPSGWVRWDGEKYVRVYETALPSNPVNPDIRKLAIRDKNGDDVTGSTLKAGEKYYFCTMLYESTPAVYGDVYMRAVILDNQDRPVYDFGTHMVGLTFPTNFWSIRVFTLPEDLPSGTYKYHFQCWNFVSGWGNPARTHPNAQHGAVTQYYGLSEMISYAGSWVGGTMSGLLDFREFNFNVEAKPAPTEAPGNLLIETFHIDRELSTLKAGDRIPYHLRISNRGGFHKFKWDVWMLDPRDDSPLDGEVFEDIFLQTGDNEVSFGEFQLSPNYDHNKIRFKIIAYQWRDD